ncbi:heavy-metal-associated domain-containing protein [Nocardioides endophyticus]|uniref:heavy-metal-associated domain-containing protein n=1 Tax=Nocardioides endophyticus TaxID=1353775 RepID=UPI0031EEAB38
MSHITTISVAGMTCGHCAASVTTELQQLDGVTDVHVNLDKGAVAIISAEPLDQEAITAAVEEAGYNIA